MVIGGPVFHVLLLLLPLHLHTTSVITMLQTSIIATYGFFGCLWAASEWFWDWEKGEMRGTERKKDKES